MCGIVGYVGRKDSVPFIIDGLKKLEYRGHDSAEISVLQDGKFVTVSVVGKVSELEKASLRKNPKGNTGVGHTRWAAYQLPQEDLSHPLAGYTGEIMVVHNGIIENISSIREKLQSLNHSFHTHTDAEIIAHLIEENLKHVQAENEADRFVKSVQKLNEQLQGVFACGVLWSRQPELLVGIKNQSPLVVGLGKGEFFLSSDIPSFLKHTNQVLFLEDGEVVSLRPGKAVLFDREGNIKKIKSTRIAWDSHMIEKGGYAHFMLKEIYDQPQAIENTLRTAQSDFERILGLDTAHLRQIKNIHIMACGSAYHAGLLGKYYLEQFAGISVNVDMASEYKYRSVPPVRGTLAIAISQSGETADTLAAVKKAKALGFQTLAICNMLGSTLSRLCDGTFFTHCGPEISVASTKAFTSQITALYSLALFLGKANGNLSKTFFDRHYKELMRLPKAMSETVQMEYEVRHLSRRVYRADRFVFLGRNILLPIALEGALKLEEVSYRSADGFAAGEIKHGPISVIDKGTPVFALLAQDDLFDKMLLSCQECRARGAFVVAVTSADRLKEVQAVSDKQLVVPTVDSFLQPVLHVVVLQFLAYWIAKRLNCEIDQPRNLAKSVTVE